jgi:hypothetical protein
MRDSLANPEAHRLFVSVSMMSRLSGVAEAAEMKETSE